MSAPSETSPTANAAEFFDKMAERYERFTGGCTREIAQFILSQPPAVDSSSVVLDNACGTGIITKDILSDFPSADGQRPKIHAVDISSAMVSNIAGVAKAKGWDNGSDGLVGSSVMDAQDLTFSDNTFTHSYTNFGIFFVPEPEKAAGHIYRTLKPGGRAYVTSWAKLGYLPAILGAQKAVRPDSEEWSLPFGKEWFREEKLREVMVAGGFEAGKVQVVRKTTFYCGEDYEDLIDILKMGFGEHVTKGWSEEEKEKWELEVRGRLTDREKEEARFEMEAYVAIAEK
ncbi:hypothetical protein FQN54_006747 [Arachnomyces sp. PD_36]|nr:hypothetical protein FQN54_006747 [Arachnomyces sp. PD_36]